MLKHKFHQRQNGPYFAWVLGVFIPFICLGMCCVFESFAHLELMMSVWFEFWVVRIFPVLLGNFELHKFCCVLHSPFSWQQTICNIWSFMGELHTSQWSSIDSFSVYLFLLLNHTNIILFAKVFPFILMPFKMEFVFRFVCLSKRTVILYCSIFPWPTRTLNLQRSIRISSRFTFISTIKRFHHCIFAWNVQFN